MFYYCGDDKKKEFCVNIFTFESDESKQELISYLKDVSNFQIPHINSYYEFFDVEDELRYKVALVDNCYASMSIQKVIKQSKKNNLIKEKILNQRFIYKVLACLWDHICTFRGNGKSNLGLNLNYIY